MKSLIWIITEEYEDVYSNRIPYVAKVDGWSAESGATVALQQYA